MYNTEFVFFFTKLIIIIELKKLLLNIMKKHVSNILYTDIETKYSKFHEEFYNLKIHMQ
jgi:hypothetical protein